MKKKKIRENPVKNPPKWQKDKLHQRMFLQISIET